MRKELGPGLEAGMVASEGSLARFQRVPVRDDRGEQVEAGGQVVLSFA